MSYRNHYSGSPWQQGGPPFNISNYGQNYGSYNDQYSMMNTGYGRNQGGYLFSGNCMGGQMRNVGYGGSSSSRYGNDRMGGSRNAPRGQMQRKRLPLRSPIGGPRSKRPNLSSSERRPSKPRRRRDSRGGSKGRGRDHSDDDEEDDTYNPAEPTDDVSDVECDGYESFKCSSDDEATPSKENGEQTAGEEKQASKKNLEKVKKLVCYVCKVTCTTEHKYKKHQASQQHTTKINELLAIRKLKKEGDDEDKEDNKKKSSRKPDNWCTVCECVFGGNFLAHRRTKEHRKKRDRKYPKCRPCRMGFSSIEEYRDHFKSEDHKIRSAEFHYLKGLASCSDEDEAAVKVIKVEVDDDDVDEKVVDEIKMEAEDEAEPVEVKKEKTEAEEEEKKDVDKIVSETKEDVKKEGDSKEKHDSRRSRSREPKAAGQMFVVSVQGYYCKLCRKFFRDMTIAKSKHCRSMMHTQNFKEAMDEALKQEEERQKLADEQDRLDQKAAEEAELAAEIAAIERSAKAAAKREAAKKKKGSTKDEDVHMKEADDGGKVEGAKKDAGAASEVPSEVKSDKNGDVNASVTEVQANKTPSTTTEKPAETPEESLDIDDEQEDEHEKEVAKEEITSSPTTRRGRGRGRGRKRR